MNVDRRVALAAILVATFANYLTITVLTIALRPVADELGASIDDVAWVTIAPALVSGLFTPAFGRLGDRIGRRRVFRAGLVLFALGTVGTALATDLVALIGSRVVTGIGAAASMPSGIALATSLYAPHERTTPMGYWTSVTAFAPALGVLVGGAVIEFLSWRYLFWAQLPFVLGSLLAAYVAVPESRGDGDGDFDHLGALLLGGAFFLLTLAANRANVWGLGSTAFVASIVGSIGMLVAVGRVESRAPHPVVPLRALAVPVVRFALLGRSLMYAVHMGSFLLLPLYLLDVAHRSPSQIALLLLPRPLAMGVAAPLASRLGARFGAAKLLAFGVTLMLAGVASLGLLDADPTVVTLLPSLVGMGLGLGLSQTVTAAEIAERTAPEDLGASSAMLAIATALSGSLGSAGLLALATRVSEDPVARYHEAFATCTVLCVLALGTALLHIRARHREAYPPPR